MPHAVIPTEVLTCGRRKNNDGWQFPAKVEKLLIEICKGKTVLHPFGGRSKFGIRMDIDPIVRPDVIADAWLPPFGKDAFDVVILDPPYVQFNMQMRHQLLRQTTWIAKTHVIWFHTVWINYECRLRLERAFLVNVGDNCHVRALEVFRVPEQKKSYVTTKFLRGPAIKYNRWMSQPQGLPFGQPAVSA